MMTEDEIDKDVKRICDEINSREPVEVRTCRKCGQTKTMEHFKSYCHQSKKGPMYRHKTCRVCESKRIYKTKYNSDVYKVLPRRYLDKEERYFIRKLEIRKGQCELVDVWQMIHIFTDVFGVKMTDLSIENELAWMYSRLLEVKNNPDIKLYVRSGSYAWYRNKAREEQSIINVTVSHKKCPTCGELKEAHLFSRCRRSHDGLAGYCKVCHKAYSEKYKLKRSEYRHKSYLKLKQAADVEKLK